MSKINAIHFTINAASVHENRFEESRIFIAVMLCLANSLHSRILRAQVESRRLSEGVDWKTRREKIQNGEFNDEKKTIEKTCVSESRLSWAFCEFLKSEKKLDFASDALHKGGVWKNIPNNALR